MKVEGCLLVLGLLGLAAGQDCVWDKDTEFPQYPPLIMDSATWISILPTMEGANRVVRIPLGASVVLACPEDTITVVGSDVADAVCEGDKTLNVAGSGSFEMIELGCVARLHEAINKNLGQCEWQTAGERHDIGYDVTGYPFYPLMEVCFDPSLETTWYVKHILRGASVDASDGNPSRPSFKSDTGFFSVSANTCYEQNSQIQMFDDVLGDSSYIDVSNSHYFARGHLAPDADFLTEMEADATYYYINCVPQWQSFNNGNWRFMEEDVRDMAATKGDNVEVYTGVFNILQLDDINNNPTEIYLGQAQQSDVIPAPDISWKVVYHPASDRGVAIIGVNNPYITSDPPMICSDVSSQINWLGTSNFGDYNAGFSYCCTVQDFKSVVSWAPDYPGAGLLTD